MAEVEATSKNLRVSSRKLKMVADSFKGRKAQEAYDSLLFVPKKSALPLAKTIKSAIANAKNNFKIEQDKLVVKEILVDQGPTLKRYRSGSRGMVRPILKRTTHLKVILEDR